MSLFFSAWQLVIRRSLANWRLLSSIIIGILVAVALLSSTPFYSNALNDLGLAHALQEETIELLDVHIHAPNYTIDPDVYRTDSAFIDQQVSRNIGELIRQEERWIKSQTFYAAWADRPIPTDTYRPRGHFHAFTNLEEHITLVEGRYADPVSFSDDDLSTLTDPETESTLEIEAMIGSETAEMFGVGVGDRVIFIHPWAEPEQQITIKLTGIIDPIDPEEEYWFLYTDIFTMTENDWITVPLFIPEQTLFEGVGRIIPSTNVTYHWFYYVDLTQINAQNAETIKNAIDRMENQIIAELPQSEKFTLLDGVITTYQQRQLFAQIPLFLLVFQIVGIVLYYVATVANMVIDRQSGEIALLRSRGASTGQILGVYFMEGLLISAIGGAVGPFLGALVFSFLGKTAPFFPLTGGGLLPTRFSGSVFLLAAGAAVLCLLAFLVPAFQATRLGVVHQRQHTARPPRAPFWQRFYLDLVILALGGMLYWELRERGSLLTLNIFGGLDIDPLLMITPMLLIIAVAIIFLRLFPVILSLAAKVGRYITSAPWVLSLWYMARNPIHYGRLILLLMMASSVGMFASSFLGTLDQSYIDRTMYSTGSDIRLEQLYATHTGKDALIERYSSIQGVEGTSAALRKDGMVGTLSTQVNFTMLAIDPETFGEVAWYRDDFSEKSLSELMDLLAEDQPVERGLALPEDTESIGIWVCPVEVHTSLTFYAMVEDSSGYYIDCELGSPTSEDWQYLEANLGEEAIQPVPPLNLQCIYARMKQGSSASREVPERIYLDDLQLHVSSSPEPVIIEDFEDVSEWTTSIEDPTMSISAATVTRDTLAINTEVVHSGTASGELNWAPRRTFGYRAIYPNLDTRPLVLLASRSLMDSANLSVDSEVYIRMPGQFMSVVIKDVVDYFPTLDPEDKGFVIANVDRVISIRNLVMGTATRYYPNEVWLQVTDDVEQRAAVIDVLNSGGYRAHTLYDQTEMLSELKADPLIAAGWGGILLIAFLGVTLVSGLGFVVYAYLSARGRQLEFAILRTLGFSLRQIISLVCLEQIFAIGAGMGIGTFIGLKLSTIMMPFLQLTERGERVVPPFTPVTDWFTIGIAYIILIVAFVITISLVVLFFRRVALHRTLRMGDE
jgi:ABC-type lipoprotein release transport system permease subunit